MWGRLGQVNGLGSRMNATPSMRKAVMNHNAKKRMKMCR
jgi:hypothetical protein